MRERRSAPWSGLAIAAAAAVGMVLFAGLTSPPDPAALGLRGLAGLPGDLPGYLLRFLLSALLLGLLPLGAALAAGERPSTIGLARPRGGMKAWMFAPLLAVAAAAALAGALTPGIGAYYPYSRTLGEWILQGRWGWFPVHAAVYLLLYYLPWEILFRGILIFPFVRAVAAAGPGGTNPGGTDPSGICAAGEAPLARLRCLLRSPALLGVASLQAIPSSLLHVGHPPAESLWAVPFGLVFGLITLQTGSILPSLAFHAATGIVMDLFILLRRAGGLP